jgi:hypothetical protein
MFARTVGMTPHRYIVRLRFSAAYSIDRIGADGHGGCRRRKSRSWPDASIRCGAKGLDGLGGEAEMPRRWVGCRGNATAE